MLAAILVNQHLADGKMTCTKRRCRVIYSKKLYTGRLSWEATANGHTATLTQNNSMPILRAYLMMHT